MKKTTTTKNNNWKILQNKIKTENNNKIINIKKRKRTEISDTLK